MKHKRFTVSLIVLASILFGMPTFPSNSQFGFSKGAVRVKVGHLLP